MLYIYPNNLTLTIYVATACLNGSEILLENFQCCDIVHMHSKDGKKMACRVCISTSPLPVVVEHLRNHLEDGQTFYWKDLAEMREVIQPFVNSFLDRLKADVGKSCFLYYYHFSIFYFVLLIPVLRCVTSHELHGQKSKES